MRPHGCSEWVVVKSTNLAGFGVHGDDLLIEFQSGAVYRYPASSEHFNGLRNAKSKGKYFHKHLSKTKGYTRLTTAERQS